MRCIQFSDWYEVLTIKHLFLFVNESVYEAAWVFVT
jgi:hypothetical protein